MPLANPDCDPYDGVPAFWRYVETLATASELPPAAVHAQVRDAVDVVVAVAQLPDGARRVVEIAEALRDAPSGSHSVGPLFRVEGGALRPTGRRPTFAKTFRDAGLVGDAASPELWGQG